ncbi:U4/U6 small nuclear ribonucleoprotein Prp31 [Smittium mucronatum]|uniref:U4/U6 small nuclear ribonucleoprotein Prp31 n=1 Tax=Smittium mucronatum TaxID=133383 RepID=A0A1R0GUD7_9FUNG|nr:U4/U6 small nuclear ribonucleoprotein Prp31 [Smittium mucronatum]OLY84630.1 U4/U6 small nuclear ribonucleoprotein Prp31 [Smittium mucronatum]
MSLQQDLINDLADLEDSDRDEEQYAGDGNDDLTNDLNELSDSDENGLTLDEETDQKGNSAQKDLRAFTKVYNSNEFKDVMERIDTALETPIERAKIDKGPIEETSEYKLVVDGNNLGIKIDREATSILKYMRDHYQHRFPELESLVTDPISYAKTIKQIGQSEEISSVDLSSILAPATRMVVAVTAATTIGSPLPEREINLVLSAADVLLGLYAAQSKLINYVESRMELIAPNLSAIVGPAISAKLVIEAEGLSNLTKIPACNLQVLGKLHRDSTVLNMLNYGPNSIKTAKHAGYLMESELVRQVPADFRSKMVRMVAAKAALAIRVDSQRTGVESGYDGSVGRKFREDLVSRVEKLLEPSLLKATKPLPVPFEGTKTRRAGKRVRRDKLSTAATELTKSANRLMFGVHSEEVIVNDEMVNLGALGQFGSGGGGGRVRAIVNNNAGKVGISKKYQKILHRGNSGSSSGVSGLATSLSFTPVQGIELSNPKALIERQNRVAEANAKYFSGGFASALPKK